MSVELRTYVFLDSLQLQMASYISTISRGYYPIAGQACCVIEIAPGIEINRLTDIALKATNVAPGLQVVERSFGLLEVHSDDQGDARLKPKMLTSQLIRHVTDHHAQLINRTRYGNMVLRGDTLYIVEIDPAGYAYYAANEAEKASHIHIIDVQGFGRFGRIYIAGEEAEVIESQGIIEARLASISGRDVASGRDV
jgi:hypothetical protein